VLRLGRLDGRADRGAVVLDVRSADEGIATLHTMFR
jgi:hypothetical protein